MEDEEMGGFLDPRGPLFLAFSSWRVENGERFIEGGDIFDGNLLGAHLAPLVEDATSAAERHGCETIIYKLVPVKRIYAIPRSRVEDLSDKEGGA